MHCSAPDTHGARDRTGAKVTRGGGPGGNTQRSCPVSGSGMRNIDETTRYLVGGIWADRDKGTQGQDGLDRIDQDRGAASYLPVSEMNM